MFFCLVTSWEDVEAEGLGFDALWRVGRFFYVPARRKTEKQQFLKKIYNLSTSEAGNLCFRF